MPHRLKRYLGMELAPVAVRILRGDPAPPGGATGSPTYCDLVLRAARGERFVLDPASVRRLSCPNPELALGFREPRFADVQPRIEGGTTAVVIGGEEADVWLFILTPAQVTRLATLLGGMQVSFRGEMAVCGEATAQVYRTEKANLSFLCQGCRELSGYRDDQVVVGLTPAEVAAVGKKIEEGRKR
ncbi:MAG: DUF169 domain-containing protein [Thermaerobacter sp.]|jgi:uncharacterized protein (DUF169 family)|nr:DUF169 domain-containing protein [Thermaerobacter sp.]MDA8145326.1 DUF169 domain-containing protein [Thermaerobacter sp.]